MQQRVAEVLSGVFAGAHGLAKFAFLVEGVCGRVADLLTLDWFNC